MQFTIVFLISLNSFSQNNVDIENKCVVVLDVQNYSTLNAKIPSDELIKNINSIIKKTKPENIIYIKSIHKVLYLSLKGFRVGLDTLGMELDRRIDIVNNNILFKEKANVFDENKLTDFLQNHNFEDVIIVGLMAECCVKESLIGGNELGYNMSFVPEAIIGKSDKQKEKALSKLKEKGIAALPINEIVQ